MHDYINGLEVDGTARLGTMFIDGWGAPDIPYVREIGKAWLVGVVARAFRPGCDMQTMLILEGEQGIGKSRSLKALGGPWYVESLEKMDNKDFLLSAHRSLIFDLAELGAYKYADFAFVKGLLSTAVDHIRVPYGRKAEVKPRRFVCVGTTNEELYLRDLTGNRRFWPMPCTKIDMKWVESTAISCSRKPRCGSAGHLWWVDDAVTRDMLTIVWRAMHGRSHRSVLLDARTKPPLAAGRHCVPLCRFRGAAQRGEHGQQCAARGYQRLNAVMKKGFPYWEPYRYANEQKPINIAGVMKAQVRGFRAIPGVPMPQVVPLPDKATVTAISDKIVSGIAPQETEVHNDNPFMQ